MNHACFVLTLLAGPVCSFGGDDAIVPSEAKLEVLWNDGDFTEGVAVAGDGRIYFSDIPGKGKTGRVLRYDPASGSTAVFCPDSQKSNGLMFDTGGRLLAACGANGGARAICEIRPDGTVVPLVSRYQGKRFNSPNDLVVMPNGSIYFSDPRYAGDEPRELDHQSVYRISPQREVMRVTTDITKPNGVHCSPDGQTLYVAETDNESGRMTLNAFPVRADGSLGPKRVLVNFGSEAGIDGMTVDSTGRIYGAVRAQSRPGIAVYTPDGTEVARIATPVLPTNCCFGRGPDARTLYITAGTGLYRIRLNVTGFHTTAPKR